MFIDASAIVAILVREPGHRRLLDRLRESPVRLTSGLAIYEAVLAIARIQKIEPNIAQAVVDSFFDATSLTLVPITGTEGRLATAAHARFGKGRHPARLNLGDCFAYACAQAHGVPLLFVGDDFPQTDIRPALG
ncbi:type II toxin-antitoxin system VapC family toxin [Methylobacterium sp. NEAU K]|uniref:type II toxin-antitoxin system VapC family toxin n=1 Tax=Methylobacterium sp. NEAU K TaxID=3064946 RepID=UPI002732D86D|nr:type II toxin-antitoxin system VapC family toxin [Methylobacterium sp. NEAU K]MDP4002780.1 type II toxin-antitoxin system VapC family toxin [Methylobacterium sp. NEAU K]